MNTITIKDVGIVTIPERNTKEEIISIVNALKDDPGTLHEMFQIKPIEVFWCEHDACLEVTDPFHSEQELADHLCKCHLHNCTEMGVSSISNDNDVSARNESDEEHMKWRDEEDAIAHSNL